MRLTIDAEERTIFVAMMRIPRLHVFLGTLVLILAIGSRARAQTSWVRWFYDAGDNLGRAIQPTSDGGHIFVGTSYSSGTGEGDILVVKFTDTSGTLDWIITYEMASVETVVGVFEDETGDYTVVANTDVLGDPDVLVLSIGANNGVVNWGQIFGEEDVDDIALAVTPAGDGGAVVVGEMINGSTVKGVGVSARVR
jgi:hypothetical protein